MIITKTDFKKYLICPKWLWVKKKRPELYVEGEMSLFFEKLISDGYEVEEYAQHLFPDGVNLTGTTDELIAGTQRLMQARATIFQATFRTNQGLFAKIDILVFNHETNTWDIYEVKSSSDIKDDLQHNHIKDITFQAITAEDSGVTVGRSFIIHLNRDYRRNGDIDPQELFIVEDVTERVQECKENVRVDIQQALALLQRDDVSLDGCECLYRSHGQRCDSFEVFNPSVPKYSVHHIVAGKKLKLLLDGSILDIKDIPDDFDLTDLQRDKVTLHQSGIPYINVPAIQQILSNLTFPLYFLDYETYGKPYPILDGYKTNQQIVFQCSLHVVKEDGTIEHFEYLGDAFETATAGLLAMLREHIGPVGSVLVWNEGFEKGRNKELAEIHPEYADFLENINQRVYDLMLVFKKEYLHPDFHGSASIKKVLPVLLPQLSYKELEIQDGTMALSEWGRSVKDVMTPEEREAIRANLLKYCKLDTLAMVEIWKSLKDSCKV